MTLPTIFKLEYFNKGTGRWVNVGDFDAERKVYDAHAEEKSMDFATGSYRAYRIIKNVTLFEEAKS